MDKARTQLEHDQENQRGAFAIMLIIAAIILVVWVSVFLLFLSRF